jgi:hypothetical protein
MSKKLSTSDIDEERGLKKFRELGLEPKQRCIACEEKLEDIAREFGEHAIEDGLHTEKGFLCYPCYEYDLTEPPLTVYHDDDDRPYRIGYHTSDYEEEGLEPPFTFKWVKTDPWRGYYKAEPKDGIKEVFSDSVLWGHESEAMLKALYDTVQRSFVVLGIRYIRVFERTSNVFCTNLTLYVMAEYKKQAEQVVEAAKAYVNHSDPVFSTGVLFPRDKPAEFELGNSEAVNAMDIPGLIKDIVVGEGEAALSSL